MNRRRVADFTPVMTRPEEAAPAFGTDLYQAGVLLVGLILRTRSGSAGVHLKQGEEARQ